MSHFISDYNCARLLHNGSSCSSAFLLWHLKQRPYQANLIVVHPSLKEQGLSFFVRKSANALWYGHQQSTSFPLEISDSFLRLQQVNKNIPFFPSHICGRGFQPRKLPNVTKYFFFGVFEEVSKLQQFVKLWPCTHKLQIFLSQFFTASAWNRSMTSRG